MPSTIDINNKRILLIAPKFYIYHIEIIKSLESLGAKVTFYPEMSYSLSYRVIKLVSKKAEVYLKDRYIKTVIRKIKGDNYDIVFVIRGCALTSDSLQTMHKMLPHAQFIMYQWDSMKQNNYKQLIKYFDCVSTFDMVDSEMHNLKYLPLFYTNHFNNIRSKDKKYDLVFYGAYHSDRLELIKYFYKKMKENNLIFKSHLYITRLALLRLLISRRVSLKDIKFFKTRTASFDEIVESYSKTIAVLDVELLIQDGLSMRTFEALGSNLRLVTTNSNIKIEDFYSSDRIMVIDRENLDIDINFFKSNIIKDVDFREFSIDCWVDKALCLKY